MRALLNRFDVRVSVVYLLVAALWIIASDTLAVSLFADSPALLKNTSIFKGLGFVITTTVALFIVVSSELQKRLHIENELRYAIQEHTRTETSLQKMTRLYRVLSNGNQILIRATDENQLLKSLCTLLVQDGGYRLAWVGYGDVGKAVRMIASEGFDAGYFDRIKLTWDESETGLGPTGTSMRTGKPSVVRFIMTDPRYEPWRSEAIQRGYASSIGLPIRVNEQVIGCMNIYAAAEDAFDTEETALLVELVNDLSYGIWALRAAGSLSRYSERLATINRLDRIITSNLDIGLIYDQFVQALQALAPLDRTSILLLNETGDQWQVVRQWSRYEQWLPIGEWLPVKDSAVEWLTANRTPLLENEIAEHENWPETALLQREGLRSRLLLPLLTEDRVIGVLTVASRLPSAYSEEDQIFLMALADQLTVAIQNADLYAQVRRHATELEQRVLERTAELNRERRRIEVIVNNTTDGIVLAHPDQRIEEANSAFSRLLACDPDAYRGQTLAQLVRPEDRDRLAGLAETVSAHGGSQSGEFQVVRMDETFFEARISLNYVDAEVEIDAGLVVTFEDITETKQAENTLRQALQAEKELNELKSRFISMASHEFRTPLATVLSGAELLLRYRSRMDEERVSEKLTTITEQVKYLTAIIGDVLDLSHMQSGHTEYKPVDMDFDALCRDILEEFRSRPDVTHELRYVCLPSPLPVILDKRLMRQMINNLVSNAVKYSPADKPVDVHIEGIEQSVVLRISDQGIGIPADDLKRLFEPFHRASNVGNVAGSGLGLTITKQAVELHGGTIVCDSEVGRGTTFVVMLPIVAAAKLDGSSADAIDSTEGLPGGTHTASIKDD